MEDEGQKLLEEILERCVPNYVRPEEKPKRRPPPTRDAFQSVEPAAKHGSR